MWYIKTQHKPSYGLFQHFLCSVSGCRAQIAASLLSFWQLSTRVWAVEETVIDVLALGLVRPPDIWRGWSCSACRCSLNSQELTLLIFFLFFFNMTSAVVNGSYRFMAQWMDTCFPAVYNCYRVCACVWNDCTLVKSWSYAGRSFLVRGHYTVALKKKNRCIFPVMLKKFLGENQYSQ